MRWTVHIEGGPRRVNHAAVPVNGVIFSFGGYCTGDNYKDKGLPIDVFVLHTDSCRWHAVPKPASEGDPEAADWPFQRYGHTVAAFGENIYLFGGRNDEAPCNVLYCFNTRSYKWSRPKVSGQVPAERDGHTSCIIGSSMYVFGGYEETQFRFGLDVYKLDLVTLTWSLLQCQGDPPIYRDFHSATAIGDCMYIFGGRSDLSGGWPGQLLASEFYTNKLHYLDTTTLTWHSPSVTNNTNSIPDGRRSHSALNLNGKLLIFGGYNGKQERHYNDLWLLDPSTWTWSQVRPLGSGPNPRRRQAMCRVGERIFIFGGTSPYDGPPIIFTPSQLELIPDMEGTTANLIDHNDLFVLDLNPSLKTLCLLFVLKNELSTKDLPHDLQREIGHMTVENTISSALKTLPLG